MWKVDLNKLWYIIKHENGLFSKTLTQKTTSHLRKTIINVFYHYLGQVFFVVSFSGRNPAREWVKLKQQISWNSNLSASCFMIHQVLYNQWAWWNNYRYWNFLINEATRMRNRQQNELRKGLCSNVNHVFCNPCNAVVLVSLLYQSVSTG